MSPQIHLPCVRLVILIISLFCGGFVVQPHAAEVSRSAVNPTPNPPVTLNLRDFGAVGNGTTDDGPSLQNALNALAAAGGGTLIVPAGRYAIVTGVFKDFTGLAQSVVIQGVESSTPVPPPTSEGEVLTRGLDLLSEFYPRTGPQRPALNIKGLQSFLIKDIAFVGTPNVNTDAFSTLYLDSIEDAVITHCEFYGLSSQAADGSIVMGIGSGLTIEQSVFLGCTANSGIYTSVVQNYYWKSITVTEAVFADYGQRPELFGKLTVAPFSWINIGDASPPTNKYPRREVSIKSVFLDEGALAGLSSLPNRYLNPSAPIDLLYVTGLYMNVSNVGTSGNYLTDLKGLLIENSHYGWSHNADSAVNIVNVNNAILQGLECVEDANRIRADGATGRLTVINSIYENLVSAARVTKVIDVPEDDAVEYVRQQFTERLERAPDPAAHFYWSNHLLQCNGNAQCETARRTELTQYLESHPQSLFGITGTVVDQTGAGKPGVTVSLSGSQIVSTQTDANGRYSFSNLPTSGIYTVVPTLRNHTMDPAVFEIVTPAGDRALASTVSTTTAVQFTAASLTTSEGTPFVDIPVTRTGESTGETTIHYSVVNGTAQQGQDVNTVTGQLTFRPGESSHVIKILITDDGFVEGVENLSLNLSNPDGGRLGSQSTLTVTITDNDSTETILNPIDDARFFVRQQYIDFLNREPDDAGLDFWANQIIACGANTTCVIDKRQRVSAAFFQAIEFQETGFLVHRLYKSAYGRVPRRVEEFLFDTRLIGENLIVGTTDWQSILESNKVGFLTQFVERPEFLNRYPLTLTPQQFVEALNANTGTSLTPAEVAAAVAEFQHAPDISNTNARCSAMRRVAENTNFSHRETNLAFVQMQYFGYLQRNPNDPPDSNFDGFNFWLNKLDQFNGDFIGAEMVRAFIESIEYRTRFGR